jgi:protein TonB
MTAFAASPTTRPNKTALAVVLLLHTAVISALVLAKGPDAIRKAFTPIDIYPVQVDKTPPPKPQPKPQVDVPQIRQIIDTPKPLIDLPPKPVLNIDVRPTEPTTLTLNTGSSDIVVPKIIDPPITPEPRKVEPAHARANLASYVSDADYPSSAIRDEQQGTTRFRLTVGADGRVIDCAVTGSSGSPALDATTCRLMKSRARFTPARDSDGKGTTDIVSNAIRWVLPDA